MRGVVPPCDAGHGAGSDVPLSARLGFQSKRRKFSGCIALKMTGMIVKKLCLLCRLKVVCFRYILLYRVIRAMLIAT